MYLLFKLKSKVRLGLSPRLKSGVLTLAENKRERERNGKTNTVKSGYNNGNRNFVVICGFTMPQNIVGCCFARQNF